MDVAKQVTQLFEAGDHWRDVMPLAEARELVGSVIGRLDRGEIRVAQEHATVVALFVDVHRYVIDAGTLRALIDRGVPGFP